MIDKSATGSTLFIEPSSVARYYEEAERLRIEEEEEILRILYTLTVLVGAASEEIPQNSCTRKIMIFPSCLRLRNTESSDMIWSGNMWKKQFTMNRAIRERDCI